MTRTHVIAAGTLAAGLVVALAALDRLGAAGRSAAADAAPDGWPADFEVTAAGGRHLRLATDNGPVHVWMPAGFDPASAGIALYLHGYYTDVDGAWRDHDLAEQFRRSGRNALFIVPEAPSGNHQQPFWRSLGELIRTVRERVGVHRPWGPVVAIGHSGAYRSLEPWLDEYELSHLTLLDALYGNEEAFLSWVEGYRGHRRPQLVLVGGDTFAWTEPLARERGDVAAFDWIPERASDLTPAQRQSPILYFRTQYGHMEMVTNGRVIPLLLQLSPLPPVP
jgi:hypothetical protein